MYGSLFLSLSDSLLWLTLPPRGFSDFSVTRAHVKSIGSSKVKPHDLPPPGHADSTRVDMRQQQWGLSSESQTGSGGEEPPSAPGVSPVSYYILRTHIWLLCSCCSLFPMILGRRVMLPSLLPNTPSFHHRAVRPPSMGCLLYPRRELLWVKSSRLRWEMKMN